MSKVIHLDIKEQIIPLYQKGENIDSISKRLNISQSYILQFLKKNNILLRPKRKYNINDDYFECIDTSNKAYVLGLLAADGCLYEDKNSNSKLIKLFLKETDKDILNKILEDMSSNYPLNISKNSRQNQENSVGFTIVSKKIFQDLQNLGLTPQKSLTLEFPEKLISHKFIWHFIRGYFDGDGCITLQSTKAGKNRRPMIIFCGTFNFLNKLKIILNQHGIIFKGTIKKRHNNDINSYHISFHGKERSLKFFNLVYKDSDLYLKRKKDKFEKYYANLHL